MVAFKRGLSETPIKAFSASLLGQAFQPTQLMRLSTTGVWIHGLLAIRMAGWHIKQVGHTGGGFLALAGPQAVVPQGHWLVPVFLAQCNGGLPGWPNKFASTFLAAAAILILAAAAAAATAATVAAASS